jgi:hypothetical protein
MDRHRDMLEVHGNGTPTSADDESESHLGSARGEQHSRAWYRWAIRRCPASNLASRLPRAGS